MIEGHPIVWLWTVLTVTAVALNTADLISLTILAVCLVATGLLAGGPRRASLTATLGLALASSLWWVLATLALPSGGRQVIARLPQYSPGPGVIFGGNLTLEGVMTGLRHALCAVVVLLVLGVAGQVVSSRGWLSLARAVLGPAAPVIAPLCCLGEACSERMAGERADRRRDIPRNGFGTRLGSFLRTVSALARWGGDRARPGWLLNWRSNDFLQLLAPVALTIVLVLDLLIRDSAGQVITWVLVGAALLLPVGVLRRA